MLAILPLLALPIAAAQSRSFEIFVTPARRDLSVGHLASFNVTGRFHCATPAEPEPAQELVLDVQSASVPGLNFSGAGAIALQAGVCDVLPQDRTVTWNVLANASAP